MEISVPHTTLHDMWRIIIFDSIRESMCIESVEISYWNSESIVIQYTIIHLKKKYSVRKRNK